MRAAHRRLGILFVCAYMAIAPLRLSAQAGITVTPRGVLPLGASAGLFTFGGGAAVSGDIDPAALPVYLRGSAAYTLLPARADSAFLSLITLGGGGGLSLDLGSVLNIRLGGLVGGYLGLYRGLVGANPFAAGEAALSFRLSPGFSLGLSGAYEWYATQSGGEITSLFSGISGSVNVTIRPGAGPAAPAKPLLEIQDPAFGRIFPVFYRYYDDNPLGSVVVKNAERKPIENLSVRLYVPQYMDAPKPSPAIPRLDAGASAEIPLYALFRDDILAITEATSVTAEVQTTYTVDGREQTISRPFTMKMQNRNEMTWDDDRKAASFVTARDPAVLKFARNITAAVRSAGTTAFSEKLRTAMAIFTALGMYGIEYVIDPASSYKELSGSETALDYLQFPSQTLDYRAGDCDDLSILYAALLESISTRAAFVTIPGHIYVAFALDMDQAEAEKTFASSRDLIYADGEAWVPVEITLMREGFLQAWSAGAKQWREASAAGAAALYPVQEAWSTYEPTGFTSTFDPVVPSTDSVVPRYLAVVKTFVEREIAPQVEDLRARIAASDSSPRLINRLGTVYARYGLYKEAEEQFLRAIERDPTFLPAMVNLGNIYFLIPDLERALDYYTRAFSSRPDDASVLVSLARTHFEREEYTPATRRYREAEILDPAVVQPYTYIVSEDTGEARASAAQDRNRVVWGE